MWFRSIAPLARAAASVAAVLFLASCAPSGSGSAHRDVPASAPDVAATDSAGDRAAIRAGYEERLRLGLGSPFRLVETVLVDPRLDPETRRETAMLLLRRTAAGETYRLDAAALVPTPGAPTPLQLERAEQRLHGVGGAVARAADPRVGELAVRLAYRLALAEGSIDPARFEKVVGAAALFRDRELARRDAVRLLRSARRAAVDPTSLVADWRRAGRFLVEQPPLATATSALDGDAMAMVPSLLAEARSLWSRGAEAAPADDDGERPPEEALQRLEQVSAATDAPPRAPLVVALRHVSVGADTVLSPMERVAWRDFASVAYDEERFAAGYAGIASRSEALRSVAASALLEAAVGMRPYAQERPWLPGFGGPSVEEVEARFGVRIRVDPDVTPAWVPFYLSALKESFFDLQRVVPGFDVHGLTIRLATSTRSPFVLATHDGATRTLVWPVTTGPGTLAHEIAHDLDWQAARRARRGAHGYASNHAATQGRAAFAAALIELAPMAGSEHAQRPMEVLARTFDWFVTSRLASQGRWNGVLSSAQDEVLTGLGSLRPPGLDASYGRAVLTALRPLLHVPPEERTGFLGAYGPGRQPAAYQLVRLVTEAGAAEGAGARNPLDQLRQVQRDRDAALQQLDAWLCSRPLPALDPEDVAAYRALVGAAAAARGRSIALAAARGVAGAAGERWMLHDLYGPPWPEGDVELSQAIFLGSLAARVRELGVAPVEPLKAGSLFRSEAVGCPVPDGRAFLWP